MTRARHEATQAAIRQLAAVLADEAPDALVVIGDDQGEWFSADSQPALCIYWGDSVENLPPPRESLLPLRRLSYWGYYGDGTNRAFPVDAALGRHLVETLTREHEFDVAHVRVQPRHAPFGHAWGFVHQRLMGDRVVPIVPVMLNTYFPPNQPTPGRCYRLGRAIRAAIEAWRPAKRVGVVASGGLSHFFVDEALDRHVLDLLAKKDADGLARAARGAARIRQLRDPQLDRRPAGAARAPGHAARGLRPSYRSEAGSGVGMAFAVWLRSEEDARCSRARTTSCCAGSAAERPWASCSATTGCRACPRASCPRRTARRRRCACSART